MRRQLLCWHRLLLNNLYFEQLIEQRAVMHHGLAQLLGVGYALLIAHSYRLGRPVEFDKGGVINRDIARPALKIAIQRCDASDGV